MPYIPRCHFSLRNGAWLGCRRRRAAWMIDAGEVASGVFGNVDLAALQVLSGDHPAQGHVDELADRAVAGHQRSVVELQCFSGDAADGEADSGQRQRVPLGHHHGSARRWLRWKRAGRRASGGTPGYVGATVDALNYNDRSTVTSRATECSRMSKRRCCPWKIDKE